MPQIITGGVVLAAVTSLPNAVAAVYLAARGRGAAMLSTTLNSNTLNVTAGLLLPATIIGLGAPSVHSVLIAVWYLGLTAVVDRLHLPRWRGAPRHRGASSSAPTWSSSGRCWPPRRTAHPGCGLPAFRCW